jgi:hypothetical protein
MDDDNNGVGHDYNHMLILVIIMMAIWFTLVLVMIVIKMIATLIMTNENSGSLRKGIPSIEIAIKLKTKVMRYRVLQWKPLKRSAPIDRVSFSSTATGTVLKYCDTFCGSASSVCADAADVLRD